MARTRRESWNETISGTTRPSRRRLAASFAALALMGSTFYAWSVPFVPHPLWRGWAGVLFAGALATLAVVAMGLWLMRAPKPGAELRLMLLVLVGIPLLTAGIGMTCAKTLPSVWTRMHGEPWREQAVVHIAWRWQKRSCDYKLYGGSLQHTFPDYLCVSAAAYQRHPGTGPATLVGRRSAFGVLVDAVEFDDARQ
jgi:hypothetical protein